MTFVTTHIASCPYPMDHSKLCCCPGGEQEIAALKAEIAELREALKPFAEKPICIDEEWSDEMSLNAIESWRLRELTVGDLRAARRTLGGTT